MNRDGIALVTILLIVVVVGILTTGSLLLSVSNLRLSKNDASSTQALAVAQAGSAYWRAELVSLYAYMVENFELYEEAIEQYIADGNQVICGNYLAIGVDEDRDGTPDIGQDEALPTLEVPFRADGPGGEAVVTFRTRGAAVVLDARGRFGGARARVVDEFSVSTVDIWNNAVFAGNSAANATIDGRAEIRGSVHVLGEGLTSSDMALDLTGSFGMGNTYKDLSKSLDVTAASMRLTNDDPHDLCATLRAKRGYVKLDGSSQIGYQEASHTDVYVDNVTGIYTNDGIQGGTINENVFSLNGMTAAYDAGNSFQFPRLEDINPVTGRSWRWGLQERALVLAFDRADTTADDALDDRRNSAVARGRDAAADGQVYLEESCYDAGGIFGVGVSGEQTHVAVRQTDGTVIDGFALEMRGNTSSKPGTPAFRCAKKVKDPFGEHVDLTLTEVIWTPEANELYVGGTAGVVSLRGDDLVMTGPNSTGKQISYKGEGIVFVEDLNGASGGRGGRVELEVDFLPAEGEAALMDAQGARVDDPFEAQPPNTYPATAIVALVADENVTSAGAQKRFTTAIYSEDSVNITEQTLVAGSIVTQRFNAGSQVPTVIYVPNLAERLSDLMPGTGSQIYAVSNVAYSRR